MCYTVRMESIPRKNTVQLSPSEQYQIRLRIVELYKEGKTEQEIADALKVSKRHISRTKAAYRNGGLKALKSKGRGRKVGEKRLLTPEQEKEIQTIIIDKTPEQMKFKECMWNKGNIRTLVQCLYKIDIPRSTLGYYLKRWGFSVQRPVRRAYRQDSKKVNDWLEVQYPNIAAKAKEENAEIYFGDETGVQNTATCLRGYAPIGKTPVVRTEAKHIKVNMLSAISCKGKLRFMLYRDNMNADKLIDFMRRLVHDSPRKVFLILDNLKVHHSKKVMYWLEKHKDEIRVFYLPPYAPEYNPDELLNSDLKRSISKRRSPRSVEELTHNVRSHLKRVQLRPAKVRSFFKAPHTRYAA